MSVKTAKKEIVLELTNSDETNNATINLFKPQDTPTSNNQGTTATLQTSDVIDTSAKFPSGGNFTLTYNVSETVVSTTPATFEAMIADFNAVLTENGSGVLFYDYITDTDVIVYCASLLYDIVDIADAVDTYNFTDGTARYISGTSIRVTIGVNGITYNELVSELSTQPYIFTTAYIKADTVDQLGEPFKMNYLQPNGTAKLELAQPTLDPNQSELVNYEVPLYMPTSALNNIQYTLQAGESVRMILRYEHEDLFDALTLLNEGKLLPTLKKININEENYERIEELIHNKAWDQMPMPLIAEEAPEQLQEPVSEHVPLIYAVLNQNSVPNIIML